MKSLAVFTASVVGGFSFICSANASGFGDRILHPGLLQKHDPNQPAATKKMAPPPVPATRDKWAVLVGLGKYQDASIPPLKYPKRNLILLRDVLKDPNFGRFAPDHVMAVADMQATKAQIESLLTQDWLVKKALPTDLIVVYLCGRMQSSADDVRFYPYDCQPGLYADPGISITDLLSEIRRRTQCKNIVCLLDLSPANQDKAQATDLRQLSQKTRVTVFSANSLNLPSTESQADGNSLFAYYLAEGVKTGAGTISLDSMAQYVSQSAESDAKALAKTQKCELVINPDNLEMANLALGVPPKIPGAQNQVKFGHSLDKLPLSHPELERAAAPGARPSVSTTRRKEEEEDESDARFEHEVNYTSYMAKMKKDIQAKWKPPKGLEERTIVATFSILKNGSITEPSIIDGTGVEEIDQSALDALKAASPLDPLPTGAPESIQIRYKFDWRVTHQ